ncbi:OB-fold domain-containing protein [Metamycoplasma hyosynoviae]|uniref:OB-fold domain-containing protein n=1 Tax=Metamycoplasma hyosynoviae TaxID=29559 RepID=UPI00236126C6|nr:OB-fold domain-containing protein [Metamycoplasma hyosynoviae]MDD1372357.1 OB-fold domain-containing protein [Metamycoplasma hyosynoviae]MDD1373083.1 OB-fold domain-containing protein [Metamycoplasma hyosynoviae]MDD7894048.1 OB-fold domain-containing protein [Metamycoplasma hyosynoviae]MDD7896117.1 OB-fold domain-containing protein [Metamycoplasma hyosynoviae]MDD7912735.1 OB-fold domain-containing protein [Metamycoplasma hyosynoviae]
MKIYLIGKIIEITNFNEYLDAMIIESNNSGYEIFIPKNANFKSGENTKVFVHYTKNYGIRIYGFKTYEEYNEFINLINTEDIGPRQALFLIKYGVDKAINEINNNPYKDIDKKLRFLTTRSFRKLKEYRKAKLLYEKI